MTKENPYLKRRKKILATLGDYGNGYTVDRFIADFVKYFDGEVDFNVEKIRESLERSGRLEQLIQKADQKNTHPVIEFIQELFLDLGKSGDVEWSGEL